MVPPCWHQALWRVAWRSGWNSRGPRLSAQNLQFQETFAAKKQFWHIYFLSKLRDIYPKGLTHSYAADLKLLGVSPIRVIVARTLALLAVLGSSLNRGSWHSKRRFACQYCGAVSFLNPGEPESLLYTAFGQDAAHRSTFLEKVRFLKDAPSRKKH